jgi:hypothetical protein
MTIFQPVTPYSTSITRPSCPKCRAPMLLTQIEPHAPDHDKRTFVCSACGHEHSEVTKFK